MRSDRDWLLNPNFLTRGEAGLNTHTKKLKSYRLLIYYLAGVISSFQCILGRLNNGLIMGLRLNNGLIMGL